MEYYIDLSRKPEGFSVPVAPSFYYLIYSLEVVLSDSTDTCLLIGYSTYALTDGRIKECIWAPPFFACHAPAPLLGGRDVGHIRRTFAGVEKTIAEDDEIQRRLYLLGAVGADVEFLGEILEYKRSLASQIEENVIKGKRYAVTVSDELALLNIIDPENLKGHVFLPVNRLDDVLLKRASGKDGQNYWFKGKPLASHLCRLIDEYDEQPHWMSRAIRAPEHLFQYAEQGLLVRFDIAGYGTSCDYIRSQMGTFQQSGTVVEEWFNGALYKLFLTLTARHGLTRLRLEGDGFIATMPQHQFPEGLLHLAVEAVLKMLSELRSGLDRFNAAIRDPARRTPVRARYAWKYQLRSGSENF